MVKEVSVEQQAAVAWRVFGSSQPARRKHLLFIYVVCAGSLQRARDSRDQKCSWVQFSVLGGNLWLLMLKCLLDCMGLPVFVLEFLKIFSFC